MGISNVRRTIDIKDKNVTKAFVVNKNKIGNIYNQNNLVNKSKTYKEFYKLNFLI